MDHPTPQDEEDEARRQTKQAQAVIAQTDFTVTGVTLVILTFLAVMYTLYFAAGIVLPFVFALILALLLNPAMRLLHGRLRLPRMLAAALLIFALFGAIGAVGYAISMPATRWIARAPETLPRLQEKLGFLRQPISMVQSGMHQMETLMQSTGSGGGRSGGAGIGGGAIAAGANNAATNGAATGATTGADNAGNGAAAPKPAAAAPAEGQKSGGGGASLGSVGLTVLSGTRTVLGGVVTLTVVLFFLLIDGDNLLRRFVEILPGLAEKKRAVQIAGEVERNISGYLVTITIMNLLVGIANGVSVWAFGLPDPLLWGTVAFLLNYIPILGPLTGMAIFFAIGLFSFSQVWIALLPPAVYFLIHLAEGETITPLLLARRFTLNPLLVIVALMFWDWLWGVPGALLAVPLLAVTKILCDDIEQLTPIGHLLGAEPKPRRR